jgi:hypothetical protein
MRGRWILAAAALAAAVLAAPAGAQVFVDLTPGQDNTLYDDDGFNGACGAGGGQLSNGAGKDLFAGFLQPFDEAKRAVVRFDLGSIPPGTVVTSATLTLNVNRSVNSGNEPFALHRVTASWGEGASNADGSGGPGNNGGGGAPAIAPDATWCERFFGGADWTTPGGDFVAGASATISIDGPEPLGLGPATWGSTAQMVADVQGWVDDPASNFGWIVIGNETTVPQGQASTKRFDSREGADPALWPRLTVGIEQQNVLEIPTLSGWGAVTLVLLLLVAGAWSVARR